MSGLRSSLVKGGMPTPLPKLRIYGNPPFQIAVLHGGPGAPGEMAPVARELASVGGVLEPLQTAMSVEGQVEELRAVLKRHVDMPVTLVGWSWGAWLGFIFAARHPAFVGKLVLIGSGPFEEGYAPRIMATRLGRLSEAERAETALLTQALEGTGGANSQAALARLGALMSRTDSYDPLPNNDEVIEVQAAVYQGGLEAGRRAEEQRSAPGAGEEHPLSGSRHPRRLRSASRRRRAGAALARSQGRKVHPT